MDFGGIPDLIQAIALLIVAVAVVSVLVKLGKLIDRYREGMKRE